MAAHTSGMLEPLTLMPPCWLCVRSVGNEQNALYWSSRALPHGTALLLNELHSPSRSCSISLSPPLAQALHYSPHLVYSTLVTLCELLHVPAAC